MLWHLNVPDNLKAPIIKPLLPTSRFILSVILYLEFYKFCFHFVGWNSIGFYQLQALRDTEWQEKEGFAFSRLLFCQCCPSDGSLFWRQ